MKNIICILLVIFAISGRAYSQSFHFRTAIANSVFTDEQQTTLKTNHHGYNFGLDVVIEDEDGLLMPGIYYQKMSLAPVKRNWKKPFAQHSTIQTIKVPVQMGGYLLDTKKADLKIHAGVLVNFLAGVDINENVIKDDLNTVRGGFIAGATFRVLFLTAHVNYEYGFSRIYAEDSPAGIEDKSKERMFSFGLGLHF